MPRANGITRQEILTCLKVQGSRTADELARELGISQVAVRQHLSSLEAEQSVNVEIERKGLGRPSHRYRLTAQGDESFPRRYDAVANGILNELRAWQGDSAVIELIQRQRDRVCQDWQPRLTGKRVSEKVKELARLLNELGFMAEVSEESPGNYKLVKKNCVLCAVARIHPDMCCNTSAAFYTQLLGDVVVERRESILDGSQSCEFSLKEENQTLSADSADVRR
jgi:DeoR family suf operon transcriptional repressor